MFGNLDEDGSQGFDAKGEMNELVQSSKRRKHQETNEFMQLMKLKHRNMDEFVQSMCAR